MEKNIYSRPKDFDEFWEKHQDDGNKYIVSRDNWLNENKAKNVIDKISSDNLPKCQDLQDSKVGDFIDKGTFQDLYDEDRTIWDGLSDDKGILCYSFNDVQSWWQIKKDKEEIAINDNFLDQVREVIAESDQDEDYNTADCLSFIEDLDYAIQNDFETMQDFYDDY